MFLMKKSVVLRTSKRRNPPSFRFASANIVIFFELITIQELKNAFYIQN